MRRAALLLATLGSALATGCAHAPPPAKRPPMTDSRQEMISRIEAANADAGSLRFIESTALTERLKVEKYQLSNGLSILVMEDHSAPVFAFQTWFRVGSRHEREGITGIAHLFEHLLFKESENLGDGVFDRILELNGGRVNASTWVDWTQYRESLPVGPPTLPEQPPSLLQPAPADRLGLVVRLEADRMAKMLLNEAQLEAERDVVKNERRYRVDNDPEGTMYEALYAEAYTRHGYRWPTVGWMRDLDAISLQDCLSFYRTFYAPNNATLVVVGDIGTERLLDLTLRHYGPLPPQPLPELPADAEPPQTAQRRKELQSALSSAKLLVGFHIPPLAHPDHPAIEVLNEILFEGKSSRAYRRLVTGTEIASEVGGWAAPFRDPGLFEVLITMRSGQEAEKGEAALFDEIEKLRAALAQPRELEKARNQLEANLLRELSSMGEKAQALGHNETTAGDYRLLFQQVERYRAVSLEDVRRVAHLYFSPANSTVIVARPSPNRPKAWQPEGASDEAKTSP